MGEDGKGSGTEGEGCGEEKERKGIGRGDEGGVGGRKLNMSLHEKKGLMREGYLSWGRMER